MFVRNDQMKSLEETMQKNMRSTWRLATLVIMLAVCLGLSTSPVLADQLRLVGSGASFPFPLYSTWFKSFNKANPNILVDYQAKGSGAGIKDFINKTVDFGASDAAMKDEEMAKVEGGVQLLPMTAGSIVLAYNIPGVPEGLKLSREVYPKIFMGEIKKWNDPAIAKDNSGVKLPDTDITVVRRADSSGTTYVFTQHLSAISEAWKKGPGFGTTVKWADSDKIVAAPKNDGVTATIKQTPGAIGYIEYGYAKLAKVNVAALENRAGKFVMPTEQSETEALARATMPPDLRVWLPDPEGEGSYPIVTYTWMLFRKKNDDAKKAEAMRKMVEYCLTEGQKISRQMGYIPLPQNVVEVVLKASQNIQ
jgi:phosphate transport system substrate-binding protein